MCVTTEVTTAASVPSILFREVVVHLFRPQREPMMDAIESATPNMTKPLVYTVIDRGCDQGCRRRRGKEHPTSR
jgi:hypothetical protein